MRQNSEFNLISEPINFSSTNYLGKYVYSYRDNVVDLILLNEIKNQLGYWEYCMLVGVSSSTVRNRNMYFSVKKSAKINIESGIHWELFLPVLDEMKYFLEFNKFDKAKQDDNGLSNKYILNLN